MKQKSILVITSKLQKNKIKNSYIKINFIYTLNKNVKLSN